MFPASMKAGMACGLLGGLVAFFALAFLFTVEDSGFKSVGTMAVYLLLAVGFFALAGGFSKTSQWNQNALILYCFIVIGVLFGVLIGDLVPLWFSVIEIILAVLCILCSVTGGTSTYLAKLEQEA